MPLPSLANRTDKESSLTFNYQSNFIVLEAKRHFDSVIDIKHFTTDKNFSKVECVKFCGFITDRRPYRNTEWFCSLIKVTCLDLIISVFVSYGLKINLFFVLEIFCPFYLIWLYQYSNI